MFKRCPLNLRLLFFSFESNQCQDLKTLQRIKRSVIDKFLKHKYFLKALNLKVFHDISIILADKVQIYRCLNSCLCTLTPTKHIYVQLSTKA